MNMTYTTPQNVAYAFKKHWRIYKGTVICCALAVIVQVAQPFLGLLMPAVVISLIETGASPATFAGIVGLLTLGLVAVSALNSFTEPIVNDSVGTLGVYEELYRLAHKQITMDYELLEDPDCKKAADKANRALQSNHALANNIPRISVGVAVNGLGLLLYAAVISMVHPLILLLLAVCAGINWLFLSAARKYHDAHREEESVRRGKFVYVRNAILDAVGAKDIRMYGMNEWLLSTAKRFTRETRTIVSAVQWRRTRSTAVDAVMILLRDGAAYAYLVYLMLQNQIEIGTFVLAFAAIGGFAAWISGLIVNLSDLMRASSEFNDLRAYYAIPDRSNLGAGPPVPRSAPGISLVDVGYTYPEAAAATLAGVDIAIAPGERIAIVGANGAGKTTLIKLICGLYKPKTGMIQIDGTDAAAFNREEYFSLFSAVFQDIHVLAESIAQNVSQAPQDATDLQRVAQCLQKVGLWDKIQALPNKEHTMLAPTIHEDATTLSGGEMQRLAMARAIYKDAPIIVLDEPTAALDPIAESEVYSQYADLTRGKTSIYISHRLASTRFCDRILFIDDCGIAEQGSHDALMAQGGKYAQMFEIQAQYYRDNPERAQEAIQ